MTAFTKGQRVRITVEYATIDDEADPKLLPWVGLEGTIIYPAERQRGFNVVDITDPPEISPFVYWFFTDELEAAGDTSPADVEADDLQPENRAPWNRSS
jgi:hypothetical protein